MLNVCRNPDVSGITCCDHGDVRGISGSGRGLEPEVYLNSTSQGELVLSLLASPSCLAEVLTKAEACGEGRVEETPDDDRPPTRRAYSSERRTVISVFAVMPKRDS